jgi:hypothetical protein
MANGCAFHYLSCLITNNGTNGLAINLQSSFTDTHKLRTQVLSHGQPAVIGTNSRLPPIAINVCGVWRSLIAGHSSCERFIANR